MATVVMHLSTTGRDKPTHKELQAGGRASSPLCFLLSEPLAHNREGFGVRHLHKAAEDGLACYRVGRANNLVLE